MTWGDSEELWVSPALFSPPSAPESNPGPLRSMPSPSGCSNIEGSRPVWPPNLQGGQFRWHLALLPTPLGSVPLPPLKPHLHSHQPRSDVSSTCTLAPAGTDSSSAWLPS